MKAVSIENSIVRKPHVFNLITILENSQSSITVIFYFQSWLFISISRQNTYYTIIISWSWHFSCTFCHVTRTPMRLPQLIMAGSGPGKEDHQRTDPFRRSRQHNQSANLVSTRRSAMYRRMRLYQNDPVKILARSSCSQMVRVRLGGQYEDIWGNRE